MIPQITGEHLTSQGYSKQIYYNEERPEGGGMGLSKAPEEDRRSRPCQACLSLPVAETRLPAQVSIPASNQPVWLSFPRHIVCLHFSAHVCMSILLCCPQSVCYSLHTPICPHTSGWHAGLPHLSTSSISRPPRRERPACRCVGVGLAVPRGAHLGPPHPPRPPI